MLTCYLCDWLDGRYRQRHMQPNSRFQHNHADRVAPKATSGRGRDFVSANGRTQRKEHRHGYGVMRSWRREAFLVGWGQREVKRPEFRGREAEAEARSYPTRMSDPWTVLPSTQAVEAERFTRAEERWLRHGDPNLAYVSVSAGYAWVH